MKLHHVQLAMPAGGEDAARAFYRDILGLAEVPKPEALAGRGGVWFALDGAALHLGVEDPFRPARKAHPGLLVTALDELRRRLERAGVATRADVPIDGLERIHVDDPFGNRLELLERSG